MKTTEPMSAAAEGYLRVVYGCATPAELSIEQRREVHLAALEGQALFIELARRLEPSLDGELAPDPRTYRVDPRRSIHPGRTALVRLGALALLGTLAVLVPLAVDRAFAGVAALVGALVSGVYALWNGRKILAFVRLASWSTAALGALGTAAGVALVSLGVYLAASAGDVTSVRRSPWVVVGFACALGATLTFTSLRLLRAGLARRGCGP